MWSSYFEWLLEIQITFTSHHSSFTQTVFHFQSFRISLHCMWCTGNLNQKWIVSLEVILTPCTGQGHSRSRFIWAVLPGIFDVNLVVASDFLEFEPQDNCLKQNGCQIRVQRPRLHIIYDLWCVKVIRDHLRSLTLDNVCWPFCFWSSLGNCA